MLSTKAFSILICLFAIFPLSSGFVQQSQQTKPSQQSQYKPDHYHSSDTEESHEHDSSESGEKEAEASINEILNCHNEARRNVDPPASDMCKLIWSEEACRNSKKSAARCKHAHSIPKDRVIKKPCETRCGENMYFSSTEDKWGDVIDDWCSEKNGFSYGKGAKTSTDITGHYTQVVWANTTMVGCAKHKCENLKYPYVFVCQYCSAGNMGDKKKTPYKAGPPCSKCKGKCENKLCVD